MPMDRDVRRVMLELLEEIAAGEIAAGEPVGDEQRVSERHDCSPEGARAAIRALEERRVVAAEDGGAVLALARDRWSLLDRDVAMVLLLRRRDAQALRDAVETLRLNRVH